MPGKRHQENEAQFMDMSGWRLSGSSWLVLMLAHLLLATNATAESTARVYPAPLSETLSKRFVP